MTSKLFKKVPVEKESELSRGGALSPTVNDIRRKLYMVGTYQTVGKRAKRMPDASSGTT